MNRLRASRPALAAVLLWSFSTFADCPTAFHRGDSNGDTRRDLSDPIFTLGVLFRGTGALTCADAADANDDGKVDLTDAVYTVGFLFLGGPPLPSPTLESCGVDTTPDDLVCEGYAPCGPPDASHCTSNDCCEPGTYCEKAEEDCDGIGVCTVRPDVCPRIFDPWCGCDGNTYSNRCQAAASGVNVAHHGECAKPPPCTSNDECDVASYCMKAEGACTEPGECTVKPEGCEKIFDPVCGCDGNNYGNPCEAAAQGVSVSYRGECRVGTPCTTNPECDPGEYCLKDIGACDAGGICQKLPQLCADFFEPVCGCDGVTYANSCYAGRAGVSLARKVPCDAGADCRSNDDCDVDSFCARPESLCGDPGSCQKRPDPAACADEPKDPVCGCDSVTYTNPCEAAIAGVSILRHGSCEEGIPCKSNDECAEALFCLKKDSFCIEPGICATDPSEADCARLPDDPICGCDNNTYRNFCAANLQGVSVAYPGECDGIPRCNSNDECPVDAYCAVPEGFCGGIGKCKVRPIDCPPDVVDPVCGCDGFSYANACLAAQAGVNLASSGRRCEIGGTECKTSSFCGAGSYCAKLEGDCDGTGQCETLPVSCEDNVDPVCGCDGITYDNECKANAAGVNVIQPGPCLE